MRHEDFMKKAGRRVAQDDELDADKPVVRNIERSVMSSSGVNPEGDLESYALETDPTKVFGSREMDTREVIEYLLNEGIINFDDLDSLSSSDPDAPEPPDYPDDEDQDAAYEAALDRYREEILDYITMDDIVDGVIREKFRGDNTYNASWWGPTINFYVAGPADDEPYAEGIIFAMMHHGGDVRGNYGAYSAFWVDSYAEEAPWYDVMLTIYIETDKGAITLDAEDMEAYNFYVANDETGTWDEGDSTNAQDIDAALDFSEFKGDLLW